MGVEGTRLKEREKQILARMQTLEEEHSLPAFSTGMIADPFEVKDQTIRGYLLDMADAGIIGSKKFGEGKQGTRIWWLPDENQNLLEPDEVAEIKQQYIDWDLVDGLEIPEERLREFAERHLSDYQSQTVWNNLQRDGDGQTRYGILVLMVVILLDFVSISVPEVALGLFAILGIGLISIGLLSLLVGFSGSWLAERGYVSEDPSVPFL